MISVSPRPLKATRNWADMPWPKAMRRRMESVPQKRAKVMSAAFFRRFRYSLQKKRGRVGFILFPQGLDGVGRRGRPGRDHTGDDADDEEGQGAGDGGEGGGGGGAGAPTLPPPPRARPPTTPRMIEATPMPPTRSVNEPMTPRKTVKARKKVVNCFSNSRGSQMERASGSGG